MTREQILTRVRELLHKEFDLNPAYALPGARLQEDLDLDSIDLVALAMRLEQDTGILLKEDRLRNLSTVEDVAGFVFDLQSTGVATSTAG